MRANRVAFYLFIACTSFIACGCESILATYGITLNKTNPVNSYTEFNDIKHDIGSVYIIVDFAHTHDTYENNDLVIVDESLILAQSFIELMKTDLEIKGYKVEGGVVSSVGLSIGMDRNFGKSGGESYSVRGSKSKEVLKSVYPPLYLNDLIRVDFESSPLNKTPATRLKKSFEALKFSESGEAINLDLPEELVANVISDKLILIGMYSRDAEELIMETIMTDMTIEFITGMLSGGNNSQMRSRAAGDSYIDGVFAIVDRATGKVDWLDTKHQMSRSVNSGTLNYYVQKYIKRLPDAGAEPDVAI